MKNPAKSNSVSTKKALRKAAIETLESRFLLSGNPTWQVQSDYFGATSSVSQPRSLRGLALSPSGADVYGGFIQGNGAGSDSVREVSTAIQTAVIGNDFNTLAGSTPDVTGEDGIVNTVAQAKGVATDNRGYVYATLSNGSNSSTQKWAIYNSSLTTQIVKETSTDFIASRTLGDIATAQIGGNYYVYVGWQNGQIERWNVNNPALPVLDTSWGLAAHPGTISLKSINSNAYLNGLAVDSNGTIYVAGGIAGDSNAFGDSLLEIPAAIAANGSLTSANTLQTYVFGGASQAARSVTTEGAMHLALYGGKIYVTEYLNSNSTIGVFYQSDLSADGIITPPNPTGPSGLNATFANTGIAPDCGFSGIAISSTGQIYLAEQEYNQVTTGSYSPNGGPALSDNFFQFDRILVSSALDSTGPVTSNLALSDNNIIPGNPETITLTGTVDDSTAGGSVIAGAQYSVDGGNTWLSMAASDGAFDRPTENVTASFTLSSAGLTAPGMHTILVRGTDTAGFTGASASIVLTVQNVPVHNSENVYFATIQAAVNGSPSGDTLTIAGGTYNETVTIADTLTLVDNGGPVSVSAFVLNSGESIAGVTGVSSSSIAVHNGATINDGLLLAASGATLTVQAGSYAQTVTVAQSVVFASTGSATVSAFVLNAGENVAGSTGVTSSLVSVNAGASIQDGVLLATSGGTVNVAAGTFSGDVNVNKSITLDGVQNSVAAPTRSGAETVIQSPDGTTELRISANDATVNGFTIQGNTNANNVGAGIYIVPGTSGTHILNNIVQNNITGLDLANASGTDQAQVSGNLFQNNNNPGAGSGQDIYADQYTAGTNFQNVLISNNTFTNTTFTENNWAIGISNTGATPFSNITVSGNTLSNAGRGMYFYDTTGATITGNAITGATHYAIGLFGSIGSPGDTNFSVTFNTVTGNNVGIEVLDDGAADVVTSGNLQIANNLLTGNTTGISVSSMGVSPGATMTVLDNNISGNSAAGLNNAGAVSITAIKNWWGSAYGPSISVSSPPKGDVIIGKATILPWRESGHNNVSMGATGFLPDAFATGAVSSFSLSTPAAAAETIAFNFTVTAVDSFGDYAAGYAGMVHFTSTSGSGLLPANATLTNGIGTFSAVLNNLGNQTITASDSMTPSITGTSANIFVYRGTFDFGTATSPVATNYLGVNPATIYSMAQGYGWQSGSVSAFDTGYTTNSLGLDPSLVRDFNYSANATFAANVPNGLYDVTVTLGDDRGFAYPQTVSFGGALADTLTTGGSNPAAIAKTYVVGVLNGQLQVGIAAAVGGTFGVIDGVSIVPDTSAFAVSSSSPANNSTAFGPINQMTVTFNHPIGGNATTASNYTITGPGGLTVTSVTANGPNAVNVNFSGQTIGGSYSLAIAAGVQDSAGNLLGPTPAINFTQAIVTSGKYDFGTATSPLAAGYTPISPASIYVPALGYGWQPGPNTITGFDTGVTAYPNPDVALTRDYDYTLGSTFSAAVGNGLYDVTLTLGDARGYGYTQNISFGGTLVDTVNTGGSNPAVVNKTYVVGVTNGQLNLGIAGVGGGFAVLDGMSFVQDTSTFSVTGTTPAGGATIYGPVNQLTVTFDHPLGANATTTSNYSLSGPGGLTIVSATPVVGSNAINLNLSGSTSVGSYMLTIGAGIQDAVNNTLGAADVVSFAESQLTTGKFDFGTATSPVASTYAQITPASAFSVSQGYGWLSGANTIGSLDTANTSFTTPDANLTRDYNYTAGSTFAANVANGLYDVTLTLGDARGYSYPQTVSFGGTLYDTLTTGGSNPAVITKTYVVGVTGGQLDVGLAAGMGGTFAVVDGLSFVPDTSAFTVSASTPAAGSTSFGPVSQMSVSFSHPIGAAALNKTNYSLSGPGGLTISNVAQVNASTVNLTFSASTTVGSYTLTIGAGVVDVAGNALTSSNMIAFSQGIMVTGNYDFGTATSPVATNYTQITPTTTFTTGLGYGWLSGTIGALDTGITTFTNPDPKVTQDFNYTTNGTFAANVPNGLYDVTLVLGDARQYTYPQTISFGGVATDTVTTGGSNGAIVVKTYVVGVTSGQLDVGIAAAMGGTYGVIDGLSFTPDMTTFGVASSSPAAGQTAFGNVTSMAVTYNHPVGASALVAANYTLTGTAGVTVASVAQTSASSVTLNFSGQATAGSYNLAITTAVKDAGGNAIAATSIPFTTAVITSAKFAFEPPASPTAAGYTAVTPGSQFNNVAGYGWATNNVAAFDTGVVNSPGDPNLNREFNYTTNDSFSVVVANGTYSVSLALGDARGYSYTMGINFQSGTGPQDTVSTGGSNGAIVNKTYTVTVTSGVLNLALTGATNSYAVIAGMIITPM